MIFAAPILVLATSLLAPLSPIGRHIVANLLPGYLATTTLLVALVAAGSLVVGVTTGWLIANCRFPGRGLFAKLSAMPLAIPSYVLAWVWYDMLGSVSTFRAVTQSLGLPAISLANVWGAAFVLVLAYHPYVLLAARAAFSEQSGSYANAARLLGAGPLGAIFRIDLSLARPALVAGVTLVVMETLADYGTVSFLGVSTLTAGVYRAWLSMGDRGAATQLAVVLLLIVLAFLVLERFSRGRRGFTDSGSRHELRTLHSFAAIGATLACTLPLLLGFVVPVLRLLWLSFHAGGLLAPRFGQRLLSTTTLGIVTSLLAVALAILMVEASRRRQGRIAAVARRIVSMGYAAPGPVVAIGVLITAAAVDHWLDRMLATGLLLVGSVAALVYAYLVRFLAVALEPVGAGFDRMSRSFGDAAAVLGAGRLRRTLTVSLPLLTPSIATAALVVGVDVMKELPATLLLRPFDFDTLAVLVFDLARDERYAEAALPALVLIGVGLVPVILLSAASASRRAEHQPDAAPRLLAASG